MSWQEIQATGSYDTVMDEYSLTITGGSLTITFEFLKKDDLEHIKSCIDCMLNSTHLEAE